MGWGTRRHWLSPRISLQIQSQNLNASMCNIISLKWPPVAPCATCQLAKCSNSITTSRPLDSQNGILNGIVAINESCIFHCPHWIVLRLPRPSLVMVGRGASGCTGCHNRHYHSSKVMRTFDTNQRQKWQTCRVLSIYIPRPAEIDSQQLQQKWCEHIFLTSSYQMQQAPSPTKRIGKQTNTSSTEQHCKSKLRTQMTPTKDSSHFDVNEFRTNKQIP